MRLTTVLLAAPLNAETSNSASLPPAGFRVSRVCGLRCAIGKFTTHRADPSWT